MNSESINKELEKELLQYKEELKYLRKYNKQIELEKGLLQDQFNVYKQKSERVVVELRRKCCYYYLWAAVLNGKMNV